MYQVLHDTNNVTDSGCHCVSADQSSRAVGSGSVASTSSSELSLLLGPVFEIKQRYQNRAMGSAVASLMPCKPRCVPRLRSLPGSLNSNTDIVIAMIVADAVKLTQSELSDSQSVNRTTLFSLSQTNYHSNHRYNHC